MITLGQRVVIVATAILLAFSITLAQKQCSLKDTRQVECSINEACTVNSTVDGTDDIGYCDCRVGLKRVNGSLCVQIQENKNAQQPSTSSLVHGSNSNHLAAAILIPLFIISLVIIGIYISHRYKVITWIRTRMNQRKSNYDEVMIGQDLDDDDDPPLR
ncbi:atp-dependent protease [Holotrichia oblita]|uniref:Atp-dependent protease n=1 Tax=Holotrichia oblita TaxID=644536 RepID=A0ACB9TKX4_HOLOL|nr:atp-dependent protease [Holotrichia oblita]